MTTKVNFQSRVLDAVTNTDVAWKAERIPGTRDNAFQIKGGKVFKTEQRLKAYESVCFEEKDLRGLSKGEKEFIRENEYKNYYDQREYDYKTKEYINVRYYIFIKKSLQTDKPTIYAYSKMQLLDIGNKHFKVMGDKQTGWNYAYWLVFNKNRYELNGEAFNVCHYEYRMSILECISISLF